MSNRIWKPHLLTKDDVEDLCPLCERPLGTRCDEHHLVPKQKGGRETEKLHIICHRKIHSVFTNTELDNYYNTVDRLLENEEIRKFVNWVKKRPVEYCDSSKDTRRRRNRR